MTGKRHHYIPRFLQRGFLMKDAKKEYTYIYLNGGIQRPSNISNVGVEGFFYSLDGETDLDDTYTHLETSYAATINKIRSSPFDEINRCEIAEIISNLEVRTNNLRRSFYYLSEKFFNQMTERFLNTEALKPLVENEIRKKVYIDGGVDDIFNNLGIPIEKRKLLLEYIRHSFEINIENYINPNLETIRESFKLVINENLKGVIKKGHVNGMIQNTSDNLKLESYKNLNYRAIRTDFVLILGDSMVMFEFEDLKEFKPFFETKNLLKSVYFPISSNVIIYGSKDQSEPNLEIINKMSAKCSSEFFIASEINSDFSSLQGLIGKNCALLTDDEMQQILEKVIADQISQGSP